MARVYEKELMGKLAREMGDTDTSNLYYDADTLFSAVNDGLADFNAQVPDQQYSVVGSSDTAYFSPDPGIVDQRLITLFAAISLTRGEIQKASRSAIIHSNVAGRTDLSRIPALLTAQVDRLQDKVDEILNKRSRVLVEEELDEAGVELKGSAVKTEGVGIMSIEYIE